MFHQSRGWHHTAKPLAVLPGTLSGICIYRVGRDPIASMLFGVIPFHLTTLVVMSLAGTIRLHMISINLGMVQGHTIKPGEPVELEDRYMITLML